MIMYIHVRYFCFNFIYSYWRVLMCSTMHVESTSFANSNDFYKQISEVLGVIVRFKY